MKSILFLVLAVPFLGGAAGERCPGVTSMAVQAACQTACGTRLLYDMCMDTLREDFDPDPSVSAEVTLYALHAAQHALESYLATVDAALELIKGSLGRDERAAYDVCVGEYGYAENSMRRVAKDMLPYCKLVGLGDEFMNGLMHLEKCRDLLIRLPGSPLYDRNLVDRNKDLLAYSLGNLLVM